MSARPLGYAGLGPIPWTAIDQWARRHGVDDPDAFDRLAYVVSALDSEHLNLLFPPKAKKP